jgi:hypothetical protein
MSKRFLFSFLSSLFLAAGLFSPLVTNVFSEPAPPTPESVDFVPATTPSGFYIANSQWHMLPASNYSAIGSFQFWSWESLNPSKNLYRFEKIDNYIDAAVAAGYQKVGIAITTYNGRSAQYRPCGSEFSQGYAQTPYFVRWGPDGIEGTADDTAIIAATPDSRDCDNDGNGDPWLLPKYTDTYYVQQYTLFVQALAQHLLNSPKRDRIAWVALGMGKDGENVPVNNGDDPSLLTVITEADWVAFEKNIIDVYHDAFSAGASKPQIPMLVQNAPFYRSSSERRDIAAYANSKDMGLSVNGITSDFDLTEACDGGNCLGMYDQVHLFGNNVPIGLESYAYMMGSENEFYWAMARAGDLKVDFLRLSSFWDGAMDTATNRTVARWMSQYIGRGLAAGQAAPPSIWSRLREHRDPIYLPYVDSAAPANYWPPIGNYEYYLVQDHEVAHGITTPITDDTRFQAADHRIGWDRTSSQPAHYNAHPYSSVLNSAGLYHVGVVKSGAVAVQLEPDPGWTARRSDQASDNYGFFFNADDRYLSAPIDSNNPHQIRITVTYLDHGNDRWRLMYDSVSGERAATLYALQDWDVATGLAIDAGLPSSGVLPDPKPLYVQKSNSNRWKVATFYITDGYFANRLAGGNDFYVDSRNETGMKDGDEYLHHVDVKKLNNVQQNTPTPTPTPGLTPTPPTVTPTPTAAPGDTISGYVFENKNDDPIKDPNEPGLPGALIYIYHSSDFSTPLAQTVSDNTGFYSFSNIDPGTYSISVTPPAGWEMLYGSRYVIKNANEAVPNQDFPANRLPDTPTPTVTPTPTTGRIYGTVFNDQNTNGNLDGNEPGISGINLRLETLGGQIVAQTQSDASGHYAFEGLSSQTYHLFLAVPNGWTATTYTDVLLSVAHNALLQNFGLKPPPTPTPTPTCTPTPTVTPTPTPAPTGQFSAFVWNDIDQDRRHDMGEVPLAGAIVIIFDGSGQTEITRMTTGGDGYAHFDLVAPAHYVVRELPPAGMACSTPSEYAFVLRVDSVIEIPFGNYDASDKVYLPLLVHPPG